MCADRLFDGTRGGGRGGLALGRGAHQAAVRRERLAGREVTTLRRKLSPNTQPKLPSV